MASLLSPPITAAVELSVHTGIEQLKKELRENSHKLSETKQKCFSLEDELQQAHITILQHSRPYESLMGIVEWRRIDQEGTTYGSLGSQDAIGNLYHGSLSQMDT